MIFEKSETLQSLINAFAGESQSRNKYTMYAKIAAKEGFKIIEEVFMETAENEREHAKLFYKEIPNGFYSPNAKYPFFAGTTYENLISSAAAERDEWENIYKSSAQIAKSEGYEDISRLFLNISDIEKRHSHRFTTLAEKIQTDSLYKKDEISQWICTNCGYTHIGKEPPCLCPVCKHEQKYFKIFNEKF